MDKNSINNLKDIFLEFSEKVSIVAEDYAKVARLSIEEHRIEKKLQELHERVGRDILSAFRGNESAPEIEYVRLASDEARQLEQHLAEVRNEIDRIKVRSS